jgi:hypothetical protein
MFVTIFDQAYARWGQILLASLAKHHPDIEVVVLGVDLAPETEHALRRAHWGCVVKRLTLAEAGVARAAKLANSRPFWLRDLLADSDPDWIFLLDADLLFRRPITSLIAASKKYDAAMTIGDGISRGKSYRRLRVAAGFVLFSKSGYGLIDSWTQMLDRTEAAEDVQPGQWFWEQTCLLDVVETSGAKILRMPNSILSSPPFDPEASVWSANGAATEKDALFEKFKSEITAASGI